MISCQEAVVQLWEYLERELGESDSAEVEHHLAFCRRCCGELEFADELRRFLVAAAGPELPPEVEARLDGFLRTLDRDAIPEGETPLP